MRNLAFFVLGFLALSQALVISAFAEEETVQMTDPTDTTFGATPTEVEQAAAMQEALVESHPVEYGAVADADSQSVPQPRPVPTVTFRPPNTIITDYHDGTTAVRVTNPDGSYTSTVTFSNRGRLVQIFDSAIPHNLLSNIVYNFNGQILSGQEWHYEYNDEDDIWVLQSTRIWENGQWGAWTPQ